jgi:undecaprenyl pyrophosphate phosphatase UppP
MNHWEVRIQHVANLLVAGTGIVYAIMRYFLSPADEWAVVNHPWQPHVQHLHVLTAPLLVFACGLIWHRHVAGNLRRNEQRGRRSGPGMLLALVPMVLSGYLIQTTVTEWWRQVWIAMHLISSAVWILAFAGHSANTIHARLRRNVPAIMRSREIDAAEPANQVAVGDE